MTITINDISDFKAEEFAFDADANEITISGDYKGQDAELNLLMTELESAAGDWNEFFNGELQPKTMDNFIEAICLNSDWFIRCVPGWLQELRRNSTRELFTGLNLSR